MATLKEPRAGSDAGHGDNAPPLPAVVGPLRGLGYILVLPFAGIAASVTAIGCRGKESLAALSRRPTMAAADTPVRAAIEVAGPGELARPLIDRTQCEFIVVDRDFRITEYHSPLSWYDELPERRAVGQHCFEVSHGLSSPCASPECECPVTKVLEADAPVVVRHHHQGQFERRGLSTDVEVVASPVRDSEGNITHIAQLIYNAAKC